MDKPKPPVTPTPELLPLHDPSFTWERFETFCEELLNAQPGTTDVHRYGTRGQEQGGIDCTANQDGKSTTIQCRHRKRFTLKSAETTVKETTVEADQHLIIVTTEVGTKVRDYIKTLPNWRLWDERDIARKIRELPLDKARRIITHAFGPAWVTAFLQIPELRTFTSAHDAFPQQTGLVHHQWTMVGRTNELAALQAFLTNPDQHIALITGIGGIGKTRFLKALTDHLERGTAFYVEDVAITPASLNELPLRPIILAMDDAHRKDDDLRLLIQAVKQRPHPTKLILTTRPNGTPAVAVALAQAGIDPTTILRLDLQAPKAADMEQLATEALGPNWRQYAKRVVMITGDSPLITVLAAQLLATQQISPDLLETTAEFREIVLTCFADLLTGKLITDTSPETSRGVLDLIAAAQPISLADDQLVERAARFLRLAPSEFRQITNDLETAGALRRRAGRLRITPDVLSDHILRRRSLTTAGEPTGYATEIFNALREPALAAVLRNFAELDWRTSATGKETRLLSQIWQSINDEYTTAANDRRAALLDEIKDATIYQPAPVLALIRRTMRDHEASSEPQLNRKIPLLLERIALHERHLSDALDLLWVLARDDQRTRTDDHNHPLRVLRDLAGYDPETPVHHYEIVIEAIERWTSDPRAENYQHSPLEVLEPLLAKTSMVTRSNPRSVQFQTFGVNPKTTRPVRERALAILENATKSRDARTLRHVIRLLGEVASRPNNLMGRPLNEAELAAWHEERTTGLRILEILAGCTTDPLIHAELIDALRWHTQHERNPALRDHATRIVTAVPRTTDLAVLQYLKAGYRGLYDDEEKAEPTRLPPINTVIEAFTKEHADPSAGSAYLNDHLAAVAAAGIKAEPGHFFIALTQQRPIYAKSIAQQIIGGHLPHLTSYLGTFLGPLRESETATAHQLAEHTLEKDDDALSLGVASAYSYWAGAPTDNDWEILRRLLTSKARDAKATAITTLGRIAAFDHDRASHEIIAADIGTDQVLAVALSQAVTQAFHESPDLLEKKLAQTLLTRLEPIPDIEPYEISELLNLITATTPGIVVEWFEQRIEHALKGDHPGYHPLAFANGFLKLGSIRSPEYGNLLRQVRDRTRDTKGLGIYYYPQLFKLLAGGYDERVLEILAEWATSTNEAELRAVARLLGEAPRGVVFRHLGLVEDLLGSAKKVSQDCYRDAMGHVYGAILSGMRTGTPGQPFPQDLAIRDQAAQVLNDLSPTSPARELFEGVAEGASHRIDWQIQEGEELDEQE